MAEAYKRLGAIELTTTGVTTIYTVPGSTETHIKTINLVNISANDTIVTLWIRDAAGAVVNADLIFFQTTIPANKTLVHEIWYGLGVVGATIQAQAAVANEVTVSAFGMEST